jgi:dUTP pyrophosphatase
MSVGAAGFDLSASIPSPVRIRPGHRTSIPTGIALEIPPGYEGQVRPRSGLARTHGVTIVNAPGTIDSDYRGEVEVLLVNLGSSDFDVTPGMRIAQVVIAPVVRAELVEAESLGETDRGAGGFGSTG